YRPGRAATWVRTEVNLVEGEPTDEVTAFLALVDTANGIASREKPSEWMYPNLDLSIHLHRQPEGRWVGLDTTVVFGGTGQGLTSTVLHDVTGPVGHAQAILRVRPQPGEWPPARRPDQGRLGWWGAGDIPLLARRDGRSVAWRLPTGRIFPCTPSPNATSVRRSSTAPRARPSGCRSPAISPTA